MPLFSKSDPFSRPFGHTCTTLVPNWRPEGPLAGPAELQNGCKSHSWGQVLINLITQSSAVGLHAQLYPTQSDGMALVRQGDRQPHWSNCSDASLAVQNWIDQLGIANRFCGDALDWQTKGSAGYGRGLNSAWRPDVDGLAIQTQVAQRPRHQCQSLQLSLTLMSMPLPHHCQ